MAFLRCIQIHSVFLIQYGQLQVDFKLFVCSIYLYKLDISAVSAVFEVTTNAVCRGRRAVYQGICDTTSKLAKLGNIKKTQIKHLWLSDLQGVGSWTEKEIQGEKQIVFTKCSLMLIYDVTYILLKQWCCSFRALTYCTLYVHILLCKVSDTSLSVCETRTLHSPPDSYLLTNLILTWWYDSFM